MLSLLAAGPGATAHAKLRFEPRPYADGRDVVGGPLDLTQVAFGQQDTRMFLRVRSAGPWDPAALSAANGRSVCIVLLRNPVTRPRTRICLGPGAHPLRYANINPDSSPAGPEIPVPASIVRPDASTLEARFTPLDAELPTGAFAWQVTSRWTDGAQCAALSPCVDHVPQEPVTDRRDLLALPRCFGAASRAKTRCLSPALRRAVVPTPAASLVAGNAPCTTVTPPDVVYSCTFGVSKPRAASTMLLVGDSHAVAWRGALEVVAQHKRWHAINMSRAGCPLTKAQIILPTAEASASCTTWNRLIQLWFKSHPEVTTVVVSAHNARFRDPAPAGYRAAWHELPSTVRRIYVIRDYPYVGIGKTVNCILRAVKRRQLAAERCAESRARVLHGDVMAATAQRLASRGGRVRYIDMTRHMCDRRRCYPVVGGALVNKPTAHLTRLFSTTVGPFMLRAMNRRR